MKKLLLLPLLILLAVPRVAFSEIEATPAPATPQRETAHGLPFSPDGRYNLGKPTDGRPGTVYVKDGINVYGSDLQHQSISLSAAQLIAMYAAPVVIVNAPGAGKSIVVAKVQFSITRTSTAFTGGGVVILQYANTANGAGQQSLDSTLAATVVTGAAGTSLSFRNGAVISDAASTVTQNVGLYLSNQTAAFAAGTGTAILDVWYYVI